jgi:hypothetical protein
VELLLAPSEDTHTQYTLETVEFSGGGAVKAQSINVFNCTKQNN